VYQSINQSIHQSINQSVNQSINQPTNQPVNQSINQSISDVHYVLLNVTLVQLNSHLNKRMYCLSNSSIHQQSFICSVHWVSVVFASALHWFFSLPWFSLVDSG